MVVYFHRNPVTYEIFYVGIGTIVRAYSLHGRNPYWYNYINKYGNPVVQIVHENISREQSINWEKYYISLIGRKEQDGGLVNITAGGDGGEPGKRFSPLCYERLKLAKTGVKRSAEIRLKISQTKLAQKRKLSDDQIEKMRVRQTGVRHSEETKLKMSISRSGENNSSKRPEVREKLRLANIGKIVTNETKLKIRESYTEKFIPIKMVDIKTGLTINTFLSINDAARFIDNPESKGNISQCCRGLRKSAYGYKWSKN